MADNAKPLLHIVVIGFHHKKGWQVEFSYPPLISGSDDKHDCPLGWKYLPTLALPDGSHNFIEDSVFFNLPSLIDPNDSVYGISCYRQIPVKNLKIRTADITRNTVQKSVCALTSIPIYGYIEVKLSLIAHAFFEQGDFTTTDILIKAYNQLNACLLTNNITKIQPIHNLYVGLTIRDIILRWRHKTLILFKLLLLQKKIVCYGSPVRPICSLILGIASLHPLLLENGFKQVASVKTSRPMSPMPDFSNVQIKTTENENSCNNDNSDDNDKCVMTTNDSNVLIENLNNFIEITNDEKCAKILCNNDNNLIIDNVNEETTDECTIIDNTLDNDISIIEEKNKTSKHELPRQLSQNSGNNIEVINLKKGEKNSLPRDTSVDALATTTLAPLCNIKPSLWGAPLPIYNNGNLCLPYLSLPYMDLLKDPSVIGYIIGTSNILFQRKKQLADVLIDVEGGLIDTQDQELRRSLQLTTEDLRFLDFIMRHVQNPKENAEGSENWIRDQFQGYMLALLKSSIMFENGKELDHFNGFFIQQFKKTQCYEEWYEKNANNSIFENMPCGHPFAGTLSVADMKLRIAQTMQNSESGRKLNQAVNTTSRAVGGAVSQVKGAFTNWWSSITTSPPPPQTATTSPNSSSNDDNDINDDLSSINNDIIINENLNNKLIIENNDNNIIINTETSNDNGLIVSIDNDNKKLLNNNANNTQQQHQQNDNIIISEKIADNNNKNLNEKFSINKNNNNINLIAATKKTTTNNDNLIEIGEEAVILDAKHKSGEIFNI